jgi:hypothetical protein
VFFAFEIDPKHATWGRLNATALGWQIARQQAQQTGFATALVATDPMQPSRPCGIQLMDDHMVRRSTTQLVGDQQWGAGC